MALPSWAAPEPRPVRAAAQPGQVLGSLPGGIRTSLADSQLGRQDWPTMASFSPESGVPMHSFRKGGSFGPPTSRDLGGDTSHMPINPWDSQDLTLGTGSLNRLRRGAEAAPGWVSSSRGPQSLWNVCWMDEWEAPCENSFRSENAAPAAPGLGLAPTGACPGWPL